MNKHRIDRYWCRCLGRIWNANHIFKILVSLSWLSCLICHSYPPKQAIDIFLQPRTLFCTVEYTAKFSVISKHYIIVPMFKSRSLWYITKIMRLAIEFHWTWQSPKLAWMFICLLQLRQLKKKKKSKIFSCLELVCLFSPNHSAMQDLAKDFAKKYTGITRPPLLFP